MLLLIIYLKKLSVNVIPEQFTSWQLSNLESLYQMVFILRSAREALSYALLFLVSWQSYSDFQTIFFFSYYLIIFLVTDQFFGGSSLTFLIRNLLIKFFKIQLRQISKPYGFTEKIRNQRKVLFFKKKRVVYVL